MLIPIALLFAASLAAQTPQQLIETGQQSFARHCASCHAPDAGGAEMGPKLVATRRLRSRSAAQLRSLIRQGVPSNGMPAFDLPAPELDALAAFVRSLNTSAAETPVPGDPDAGRAFFLGQGKCDTCHMVRGHGSALGPDLSNVARELTAGEIRQVLLNPASRITPGYDLVSVRLRGGQTLRGFARNRTNFDLQLQTLDGRFHLVRQADAAAVTAEKPMMPAVSASPDQLRDLVAYLSRLTRDDAAFSPTDPTSAPGVPFERIRNPRPGDWLTYNGTLDGNRYSALIQINRSTVANLGVKWMFPIDHFGLEVTPVVADGVMYVTGPNTAIALDALSGRQLWKYSRPRTPGLIGDASLGTNRGVAILGDRVFMSTDNAHLIALNRTTGALVWDTYMPEEPMHYGSTVAPLPVGDDTIVAGVSGGDRGMRGFLAAYKASTGERLWRL
jgi:putative heme-binding domain-containing protein